MPKAIAITQAQQQPSSSPSRQIMMPPPYMNIQPPAYPHHTHNPHEVNQWRSMYATLITHYESNGHSRVDPQSNPQLAAWLAEQERRYLFKSLTTGQIQQLALMKVHFIQTNESKLGIKCSQRRCTKFGAFEGLCHEHYYSKNKELMSPQPPRDLLHDPSEKKNKKKKEKGKKKGGNVKVVNSEAREELLLEAKMLAATKGESKSESAKNKPATGEDEIVVPALPPMKTAGTDDSLKDSDGSGLPTKTAGENLTGSSKPAEPTTEVDAEMLSGDTPAKKLDVDDISVDSLSMASDTAEKMESSSKEKKTNLATKLDGDTADDEPMQTAPDGTKDNEGESIETNADAQDDSAAKKSASGGDSERPTQTKKKSPPNTAKPKNAKNANTTKTSLTRKKPMNPIIAAAVSTMMNRYPPAPPVPPPSMYPPHAYGWTGQVPAQGKRPSLQDQHNQNIWLKHYGSLILFYEQYGHSKVTLQFSKEFAPPSLVAWVNQQRERYKNGQLNQDEIRRLDLLGFRTTGKTNTVPNRCVNKGCNKYAVFNGKCHSHYSQGGQSNKRQATPNEASYSYFSEPQSKKSKLSVLPTGSNRPFYYIGGAQPAINPPVVREKKVVKKLVKATKPKFPLVNSSKQKNGLWSLPDYPDYQAKDNAKKLEDEANEQDENAEGEEKDTSKARSSKKIKRIMDQTDEQVIEKIEMYVTNLASRPNCINDRNYYTQCTCLHYLRGKPFEVEAVSRAIFDYCKMEPNEKNHYALERIRMVNNQPKSGDQSEREGNLRPFLLPTSYKFVDDADLPNVDEESKKAQIEALFKHKICSSTWHNFHHNGPKSKETLLKYLQGDTSVAIPKNTLGIKFGSKNGVREKVIEVLQQIYDEHLRDHGTDEIINGKKVVVLPASLSKKQLFRKFVADQGWKVTIVDRKKNTMGKLKDWPLLEGYYATAEEAALNNGKLAGSKVNHTSFTEIWKSEFPHLKVVEGMMKGGAYLHQREHVKALLQSLWDEYSIYDNNPDETVLLPFSMRNLYHTWIREQGWMVREEKGRMVAYKDWELLPGFYKREEEAAEKGGKVAGDKISYPSFYNIWRTEYPRLKVNESRNPKKKKQEHDADDDSEEDEDI